MLARRRQLGLGVLCDARRGHDRFCRDVEAYVHASNDTAVAYTDAIQRIASNLTSNSSLYAMAPEALAVADDATLMRGGPAEQRERERVERVQRFEAMLQEKYEALDDKQFRAIVRCRRCGHTDVTWEEKQTRSADEAASVYVVCTKCHLRWVMR